MDKLLDTFDHLKLNQEDINHLNRSITCNEIEAATKKKRKVQDLIHCWFLPDLYRRTYTNTPQIIPQNKKGRNTAKLILLGQYYTHPTTGQGHNKKRELQIKHFNEHRCKNPQKLLANRIQQHIRKIIHHDQVGFIPGMQGLFNIRKSLNVIQHINRNKDKTTQSSQ
jgi:hypothetical protein